MAEGVSVVSVALDAVTEARHAVVLACDVSLALDLRLQFGVLVQGLRSDSSTHRFESIKAAFS